MSGAHTQEEILEMPNFSRGVYLGTFDEVTQNVKRYGDLERCTFVKGWFDDTLPHFSERIVVGYIDVDLASSTKSCLKFLFPRIQPGGSILTQDGYLPYVIQVLEDESFWGKGGLPKKTAHGGTPQGKTRPDYQSAVIGSCDFDQSRAIRHSAWGSSTAISSIK